MARDTNHMVRFFGNRMMFELILGRRLNPKEAIKVYNISNKKTERFIYGSALDFDLTEFQVK